MNIGRYKVIGYVGRGGMAEVFKCQLSGLGGFEKIVVIKRIIPERLHDPTFARMFLDEARLVARLSHQNVVQVFEIDAERDVPYIVMEYIHGPTFSQALRRHARTEPQNSDMPARVVAQIASGLGYSHEVCASDGQPLRLVHRDVNPNNILISSVGVPKLVDFGVAKASTNLSETAAGTLKGKVAYMSPEQVQEQPIDGRSDIFSLGVVLYEATTGRMPFGSQNALAVLQAIVDGNPTPPAQLVDGYPKRLNEIVMWALETDPAARCPTAMLLHDALHDHLKAGRQDASPKAVTAWVRRLFPESNTNVSKPFLDSSDTSHVGWGSSIGSRPMGVADTSFARSTSGLDSAFGGSSGEPRRRGSAGRGRWPLVAAAVMTVAAAAILVSGNRMDAVEVVVSAPVPIGSLDYDEPVIEPRPIARGVVAEAAARAPAQRQIRRKSNKRPTRRRARARDIAVVVSTLPPAEIVIDDMSRGISPVTVRLPAGEHVVVAFADGYLRDRRSFDLPGDQPRFDLRFVLKKKPSLDAPFVVVAGSEPKKRPSKTVQRVPQLPRNLDLHSSKEILRKFNSIERELVAAGVDPDVARNVTSPLARQLVKEFTMGRSTRIYPLGTYRFILNAAGRGKKRGSIAISLKRAHSQKKLNY